MRGLLAALLLLGLTGCVPGRLIYEELDHGVYVGRMPNSLGDVQELKARGIRTVLSLQAMPWDVWPESRRAHTAGITLVNVPMWAVPWPPPSEDSVRRALTTMHDPAQQPVFLHCRLGSDRAAMVAGLYRVYYLGWSPENAWKEMLKRHFQTFGLYGYGKYFWHHTDPPQWARQRELASPQ